MQSSLFSTLLTVLSPVSHKTTDFIKNFWIISTRKLKLNSFNIFNVLGTKIWTSVGSCSATSKTVTARAALKMRLSALKDSTVTSVY